MIFLIIIGWVGFAIVAWGGFFAYFQGEYPGIARQCRKEDYWAGLIWSLVGGPVAFVIEIFASRFFKHGWRLR